MNPLQLKPGVYIQKEKDNFLQTKLLSVLVLIAHLVLILDPPVLLHLVLLHLVHLVVVLLCLLVAVPSFLQLSPGGATAAAETGSSFWLINVFLSQFDS